MDNKKLVTILLNDIAELEELITEMKRNQHYEPIDMEFLHARTKGVRQMMEMLVRNLGPEEQRKPVLVADGKFQGEEPVNSVEKQQTEIYSGITENAPVQDETGQAGKEGELVSPPKEELTETETTVQGETKTEEVTDHDIGLVDEAEKEEPKILGEKFTKEKSLNELLSDQSSLESKFTNLPINNLQAAIGINDRFLYIRELFAGDAKKFDEVVKRLDSLTSLQGAIEYLKENFQWKKNETSQKFLNLVKRRYANA